MKKATHSEEQSRPRKANDTTKPLGKIGRILSVFLTGDSINRFEAERSGNHCLNSTVSVLANTHGLLFERQYERVPNHWGEPCRVTRYRLPASEHSYGHYILSRLKHARSNGEG